MGIRRGDEARARLAQIISEGFGDHFLGIADKKLYLWVEDGPGGEPIQFAITITMPKNPIEKIAATEVVSAYELTPADKAMIEKLKAKLNI